MTILANTPFHPVAQKRRKHRTLLPRDPLALHPQRLKNLRHPRKCLRPLRRPLRPSHDYKQKPQPPIHSLPNPPRSSLDMAQHPPLYPLQPTPPRRRQRRRNQQTLAPAPFRSHHHIRRNPPPPPRHPPRFHSKHLSRCRARNRPPNLPQLDVQ